MESSIIIPLLCLFMDFSITFLKSEKEDNRCEMMMKRIDFDDRMTVTDNTPSRLHSTWISQEATGDHYYFFRCEIRAGPKYIIRKYSFFKNDTFLLLQYHYDEESCSIAAYTVIARGSVKILSPSIAIPGAAETNVQLDSVYLIPFNRQIAHKFGRIMNASCGGIETKWRPYLPQLIYERSMDSSLNMSLHMYDLNSNSLQSRLLRLRKRHTIACLDSFEIDFTELKLLRVEIKRSSFISKLSRNAIDENKMRVRIELLLGGPARNIHSQKMQPKPNRLQSTSLLRVDTAIDCPICGSVYRATEYSPPLFHQTPPLPAVIDGFWLSIRCESVDGGFWSRRFFRIYSDDNRWFARWSYYSDSMCSNFLYTVTAAGTYLLRAVRQTHDQNLNIFNDEIRLDKVQKSLELSIYPRFLQDIKESVISRSNQKRKMRIDPQKFIGRLIPFEIQKHNTIPSGTTELELQILESLLIPVGKIVSTNCRLKTMREVRKIKRIRRNEANLWSKNCKPRTGFKTPTTLKFKAKIGLDWKGDYTLLLASWKDDLWEAPLQQCYESTLENHFHKSSHSTLFRQDNWYDRFSRRRRDWFPSSFATCLSTSSSYMYNTILFLLLYCLYRVY